MNKKVVTTGAFAVAAVLVVVEGFGLLNYKDKYEKVNKELNYVTQKEQKEEKENELTGSKEYLEEIKNVRKIIDENYLYDVDQEQLLEATLTGMMWGIDDPYAAYFSAEEFESFSIDSLGTYSGVGAVLTQLEDGTTVVVKIYPDSPAEKGGIHVDDVFYEIDDMNVVGKDSSTIASMLKGEEGTEVKVTMYRETNDEYIPITLTRSHIEIPSVSSRMIGKDIGYVKIESWDAATVKQFRKAIVELHDLGMTGMVIDVRNNPGGIVSSATSVLDLFVEDNKELSYTIDKKGNRTDYIAKDDIDLDMPIVILVNENTASASEIFAGGMRDYKEAILVGEKTYGKGIVQSTFTLKNQDAIKLTIGEYYLPNGECIHKKGIEPDVSSTLSEKLKKKVTLSDEEDTQLKCGLKELKKLMEKDTEE